MNLLEHLPILPMPCRSAVHEATRYSPVQMTCGKEIVSVSLIASVQEAIYGCVPCVYKQGEATLNKFFDFVFLCFEHERKVPVEIS